MLQHLSTRPLRPPRLRAATHRGVSPFGHQRPWQRSLRRPPDVRDTRCSPLRHWARRFVPMTEFCPHCVTASTSAELRQSVPWTRRHCPSPSCAPVHSATATPTTRSAGFAATEPGRPFDEAATWTGNGQRTSGCATNCSSARQCPGSGYQRSSAIPRLPYCWASRSTHIGIIHVTRPRPANGGRSGSLLCHAVAITPDEVMTLDDSRSPPPRGRSRTSPGCCRSSRQSSQQMALSRWAYSHPTS